MLAGIKTKQTTWNRSVCSCVLWKVDDVLLFKYNIYNYFEDFIPLSYCYSYCKSCESKQNWKGLNVKRSKVTVEMR